MGNVLGCHWRVRGIWISCGVVDQLASFLLSSYVTSKWPYPKRLPFYWEIKTIFLLFLSLPQTQVHLSRFLAFESRITHLTPCPRDQPMCIPHIFNRSFYKTRLIWMRGLSPSSATFWPSFRENYQLPGTWSGPFRTETPRPSPRTLGRDQLLSCHGFSPVTFGVRL